MSKILLLQGNQAVVEGAIAAGVKFFGGYAIQMEDEIASMGAIIGAALTGKKVMTATSGPGFSLKQELIGYACMAEIPLVIVNVQRVGPSTGQPTSPSQGDLMQARWGTHGDHWLIALTPASVPECFELTLRAYALSEKYRVPVVLLMDEVIGHMREKIELPNDYSEIPQAERKRRQPCTRHARFRQRLPLARHRSGTRRDRFPERYTGCYFSRYQPSA